MEIHPDLKFCTDCLVSCCKSNIFFPVNKWVTRYLNIITKNESLIQLEDLANFSVQNPKIEAFYFYLLS